MLATKPKAPPGPKLKVGPKFRHYLLRRALESAAEASRVYDHLLSAVASMEAKLAIHYV